ncbi:phosphoglycerate mutase [Ligilactobacillus acidipiscis DSM 15836]|jgi:probable phosphoglycerate mutase|uniref:Histidine phosphatase family protein n=2 Tax=Ligilactobacillus acidipiscis TaxID=89059 RepID=A0A0R2JU66_9LACO|nr:histidine phosphatase family protein [Ligilactobacillus acidipiscis]KRM23278.1 phosphoglycerate mutase [Ligilactobacillus acidipiscis DSM 15836]KRN78135.1 phosphoglycerate mutase [Ligilactobacillus acidipiscis]WEV56052.1 histidine phosphatase family protein [Ligilactobacillus acidipiscis]SFV40911.1 Phosphoglycerate mutase family [Ligilactobacillus acidipiscis]GAW64103.1 phosphoglycerate mutase [Ligilactobacillus acidipiscis]
MGTTHFYLVRHGQTQVNRLVRLQGTTDSALTVRGIRDARKLGRRLADVEFSAVFASNLRRTQETANNIIQMNEFPDPPSFYLSDLREFDFGQYEEARKRTLIPNAMRALGPFQILRTAFGKHHANGLVDLFDRMSNDAPLESSADLSQRMTHTLEAIARAYGGADRNILIVTHGLLLSSFIESLNGSVPLLLVKNTNVVRVDYEQEKFVIKTTNFAGKKK